MSSIKKRTITVKNMTCSGCEQRVEEELTKLEGIHLDAQIGWIVLINIFQYHQNNMYLLRLMLVSDAQQTIHKTDKNF